MSTRRTFLKQTAIATAGLAIGLPALGNLLPNSKTKVIIIGAGFAGLAAAYRLHLENVDFIILESRNRIGGRVFSNKITNDLVIEFGGEWVGNSHFRIQELCREFELELQNNQFDTHLIYKGEYSPSGKWDYSEKWNAKFQEIIKNYPSLTDADKIQLDKTDWWRYLVQNGCNGRDLDIRELMDSTDFGESIRHVSAFSALSEYAESSEKNEMDLKIKGGNGMLAEKLADKISKDKILLQHSVTRIEQGDKVKVLCANGQVLESDNIICTIPTFAINKIDWQPALPLEKMQALNELQYARINKHAMVFDKRFWGDESFDMVTDELPHYFYHATKNQKSPAGVLMSYSIGDKAAVIANQNNERNAQMAIQTLEPHFGKVQNLLTKQANYYWGNDDISKGAYAIYGKGQWFRIRPILQEPFLHTHFAGEHLADWQGFMEGAINTGEDAAAAVIG
ncbi:NAD(P)-binding protein [Cryomorpha ignava]|uniref:NAD(P)-binding protein n=1 Tax=Cryomorpha ignava TaxID=101383 RepID=A0A7K3WW74_9FLAO|nr:FAD-dependent oxidoreductase [Cryomorpha ignava]NEN25774.1 NAD(P)-binding protein [Cryomorpha ignava]